jgi:hypothetical protein
MSSIETGRACISKTSKIIRARWNWILLIGGIILFFTTAVLLRDSPAPPVLAASSGSARYAGPKEVPESPGSGGIDKPLLVPAPPEVDPALIVSLLPKDAILAIDEPQFHTADEASDSLSPDERIIGLVINGDARAYPIPVLSVHEIVNDTVGGEPVAVTWCPLCYTALVYSRHVDDETGPLSFGVSGKLLNETLVMYDRQSDSLWSQLYGAAVDGPMVGARLAFFPSTFTEWEAWQQQHPDTLVLDKSATCAQFQCGTYSSNPRGSYSVDPYKSYYNSPSAGVVDHQIPRDAGSALETGKERVLGVRVAGVARAYPYEVLANQSLINDEIAGIPVLVWFQPETQTSVVFLRTVDEMVLSFNSDASDPAILVDEASGSRWDATSGTAVNGLLKGTQLSHVFATPAFAFGWYDYFPGSETYYPSGMAKLTSLE